MPDFYRSSYIDNSETDSDLTVDSEEEDSFRKNTLILCEIFHPSLHGFTRESDKTVLGHFLVIGPADLTHENTSVSVFSAVQNMLSNIRCVMERYPDHPQIRNYKKLILRDDYIRPEIAECILLKGDEKVAILKTVWLRIVQRAWKKIFQERCRIRSQRMTIYSIGWRQIHGTWPKTCAYMPTIHGMLSGLKQ
uniref:Uncharacterized protein n=1 Tax=viral metagenome TaxID=1070528 RepID=A0A6C0LFA4_9ZZZZ